MLLKQAKKDLTEREYAIVNNDMESKGKKPWIAYVLWVLTGAIGGHRFYLGDYGYAIAMLCFNWMTLGIWMLVDLFLISGRIEKKNEEIELGIIDEVVNLRERSNLSNKFDI